jgi:fluoride exporter
MRIAFWVAVGSGVGGTGRVVLAALMARFSGPEFPYGVFIANIGGSFAIGFIARLTAPDGRVLMSAAGRQFLMAGLCGGFTTFSVFSLQTMEFLRSGQYSTAGLYATGTLFLSMLAVFLGHASGAKINRASRF